MRRFGVLMVVLMLAALPASAQLMYGTIGNGGTSSTSTLVEIDPATGALVATIGDVGYLVNGMTWDASSGTLYATTSNNDSTFPDGLITIDPLTAAGTPIGTGAGQYVNVPASNSFGQVYGWTEWSDDAVLWDTAAGTVTVLGESGVGTLQQGLAFNSADVLYLVNYDGVYTIDTATGAGTYVGDIGTSAHHGDFEPTSGLYYGIDAAGSGTKNLVIADLASFTVVDTIPTIDDLHTLTFSPPLAAVPGFLEARLNAGNTENQGMTILNFSDVDANVVMLAQQQGGWVPSMPMDPLAPLRVPESAASRLLSNLSGVAVHSAVDPGLPLAAGDVFQSWPSGAVAPWGTGFAQYTDNPWASSISLGGGNDLDYEYTSTGIQTGKTIDTSPWNINGYAADMAFNSNTGKMWQMNVNIGDQYFMELDPVSGASTGNMITVTGPETYYTGLAYDPVTDTFFFGGWNDGMVFRVDTAGTILQSASTGLGISGLAYNPVSEHLFVMTNASPNLIYLLDVADSYTLIGSFAVPGFGDFAGAGLGISCDGHLWAVNQGDGMVYEFDSEEPLACLSGVSLPWLVLTPEEGFVPAAEMGPGALPVNVEFIADGLDHYGLVQANISVLDDTSHDINDPRVCFTKAFYDVGAAYWADEYIHSTAGARITGGCGSGSFCPTDNMLRHVMALWLVKLMHGPDFSPPPCTGIFEDVVCESTPNSDYIEQLYADGVTTGCSQDPLLFCPDSAVNRAQMAVFILRALEGAGYVPPPCVGIFDDVACPAFWAADYIENLYALGITTGCSQMPPLYCAGNPTNRAQMSAFVQRAWDLPMCE